MVTKVDTPVAKGDRPLPDERLKEMLYLLKLCRYFDERMEALYRQGRLPGAIYSGGARRGRTSASRSPWRRTTRSSPRTATCPRS